MGNELVVTNHNNDLDNISIEVMSEETYKIYRASADIKEKIHELDVQIDLLSSHADNIDYFVAIASGILCGMLDVLWVGDFDFFEGRDIASDKTDKFVVKMAKLMGYEGDDVQSAVKHLEKKFPFAADGNTPEFGGGLQHHLRDFSHHPTIVGLVFSLLTQFTGLAYGTDTNGMFICEKIKEDSMKYIGKNIPEKIALGTWGWFWHLVSDMAGSSATAGVSGGTGIPGPLLSLAKELSALPIFKDANKIKENSVLISKLFNGTYFMEKDENGKPIKDTIFKFDLRGERALGEELKKQAIPVIANDCIVRTFYLIRRFYMQLKDNKIKKWEDFSKLSWEQMKPYGNPTIARMLTIATGVFTAVDLTDAIATQKYWVAVNYVGIGRFAIAIGTEAQYFLKIRNLKKIRDMYTEIEQNIVFKDVEIDNAQLEILYNIEYYKVLNDANITTNEKDASLKKEWLEKWKTYIEMAFPSLCKDDNAKINWYNKGELLLVIGKANPKDAWLRRILFEIMLFKPYYFLEFEVDKNGAEVPSKKYSKLSIDEHESDKYLDSFFDERFFRAGYVEGMRKSYKGIMQKLSGTVVENAAKVAVGMGVATGLALVAAPMAPAIAVSLVGSLFPGLHGAALTGAALAYLGGGALSVGGLGVAGGTTMIVGSSALLGMGLGTGASSLINAATSADKEDVIKAASKEVVLFEEVLNSEHNLELAHARFNQYVSTVELFEKALVEVNLKKIVSDGKEKKRLSNVVKQMEENAGVMEKAMKEMHNRLMEFEEA